MLRKKIHAFDAKNYEYKLWRTLITSSQEEKNANHFVTNNS